MIAAENYPVGGVALPDQAGMHNVASSSTNVSQPTKLPDQPHQAPPSRAAFHRFLYHLGLLWEKITIFALTILALHNLWLTLRFIIVEYPIINEDFAKQTITDTQIRIFLSDAIALMVTTLISILFAIRLNKAQERWSKFLELIFGSLILIFHQYILDFLRGLDYTLIATTVRQLLPTLGN